MCYISIHMDLWWHFVHSKVMISDGIPSTLSDFVSFFSKNLHILVSMAMGMHMDERSVVYSVLCPIDQDRKVSAKWMTTRGTTF